MRKDFPCIWQEMTGGEIEEPELEDDGTDRWLHDHAVANVDWAIHELRGALAKGRKHVSPAELAAAVRGSLRSFEVAMGRPWITMEEAQSGDPFDPLTADF